jgi:hypothetical protein
MPKIKWEVNDSWVKEIDRTKIPTELKDYHPVGTTKRIPNSNTLDMVNHGDFYRISPRKNWRSEAQSLFQSINLYPIENDENRLRSNMIEIFNVIGTYFGDWKFVTMTVMYEELTNEDGSSYVNYTTVLDWQSAKSSKEKNFKILSTKYTWPD